MTGSTSVGGGRSVTDLALETLPRVRHHLIEVARRGEPNLASLVVTGSSGEVGAEYGTNAAGERARLYALWTRPRT